MPSPPFDPAELTPLLQRIPPALLACAPPDAAAVFCSAQQSARHAAGRLEYAIGDVERLDEARPQPSPELHDAAYAIYRFYRLKNLGFPGLLVTVTRKSDGKSDVKISFIDPAAQLPSEEEEERRWQAVYNDRSEYFTDTLGPLPGDIQKVMSLSGLWPGGGLFQFAAPRAGGLGVCASFGLSNYDLPTTAAHAASAQSDDGRSHNFTLAPRTPRWMNPKSAGYGYELMILTPQPERWPLGPIAWLAEMELKRDLDLLTRVIENQGITIETVHVGGGQTTDFIVAQAREPLPVGAEISNGTFWVLIATRVTRDEMEFARAKGTPELLDRLYAAGVGQVSDLARSSVLR
jgi:hypothetical protein